MSKRQRYYTPRVTDEQYDKMLNALRIEWSVQNDSDIVHRAIVEAYKRTNCSKLSLKRQ